MLTVNFSGIATGLIKVYYGYAPGQRSPRWNQTETWSAVHGQSNFPSPFIITVNLFEEEILPV